MAERPIGPALDDALRLILSLDGRRPAPALPKRLDALFADLARFRPTRPAHESEDAIWALWAMHDDPAAAAVMEAAIRALAARRYAEAEAALAALAGAHPGWAEVRNKQATLFFLQGRDAESVAAIVRTLELEPRHFGAISGFAQICLRHGREADAVAAFEVALGINPHLVAVAELVRALRSSRRVVH